MLLIRLRKFCSTPRFFSVFYHERVLILSNVFPASFEMIDQVAKSFSVFNMSLLKKVNAYLIHYVNGKNMLR